MISGVSLIVSKWNDSSINKRIQDVCTSIKLYSSHDNVSTELSFEIAYIQQVFLPDKSFLRQ